MNTSWKKFHYIFLRNFPPSSYIDDSVHLSLHIGETAHKKFFTFFNIAVVLLKNTCLIYDDRLLNHLRRYCPWPRIPLRNNERISKHSTTHLKNLSSKLPVSIRSVPSRWSFVRISSPLFGHLGIKTMFKIKVNNILRRFVRLGLLVFHGIILIDLFYEIICSLQEEMNKELFNSIQCGLTAVVSFLSYAFYVWHCSSIQVTLSKLRKTDGAMKSIGIREDIDSVTSTPIQLISGTISIAIYAYSKYLRNLHLAPGLSMALILKNVFVRTYFVATNGFVMVTFINKVHLGKRKFQLLNHHVEYLVGALITSLYSMHIRSNKVISQKKKLFNYFFGFNSSFPSTLR